MKKILLSVFITCCIALIAVACTSPIVKYMVTLPEGQVGYTVTGESKVKQGENYTFTVVISEGYEKGENFAVKVNSNEVTLNENGIATVENIQEALTVTIEGVIVKQHNVTLPSDVGYTISGESKVNHGENYTFTVTISEGYDKGENFAVKVNGNEVALDENGSATIENVQENLTITVEGLSIKQYGATLTAGVGYTISGESKINHGANYTFTVTISEGYEKGENFAVKVNGNEVALDENGSVTIENVQENLTITVEGVTSNVLTVTLPSNNGYTVTGATEVKKGEAYTFTLTINEGYEKSEGFAVKVNGNEVALDQNGCATIENVQENLTITVEGVSITQYDATLTAGVGYTISGESKINHGANYTFTIVIHEGYKAISVFKVSVNGNEITLDQNGCATIENVQENLTITVEGVADEGAFDLEDDEIENDDQWWN